MGNTIAVSVIIDEEEVDDYKNYLGKRLGELYETGQIRWVNVIKAHRFTTFGSKYNKFMLMLEESAPDNVIILFSEIFEGICDLDDPNEWDTILEALRNIELSGKIIPSVDFMFDTCSKKYA